MLQALLPDCAGNRSRSPLAEVVYDVRKRTDGKDAETRRETAAFLASVFRAWGKGPEASAWRKLAGG